LPRIAAAAGGLTPFDLRPAGYSLAEARAFVTALPPDAARFYMEVQQRLDTAYPALLALMLGIALWQFSRGAPQWQRLAGVALCAATAGFDWLENARVAAMLQAGPEGLTAPLAEAASRATLAKSVLGAAAMTVVLALALARLWQKMRRNRHG